MYAAKRNFLSFQECVIKRDIFCYINHHSSKLYVLIIMLLKLQHES